MGFGSGATQQGMCSGQQCSWSTLLGYGCCTQATTPVKKTATCGLLRPRNSPQMSASLSQPMACSSTSPAWFARSASPTSSTQRSPREAVFSSLPLPSAAPKSFSSSWMSTGLPIPSSTTSPSTMPPPSPNAAWPSIRPTSTP